jgi:Tfp pilus assembly protein PilW
MIGLLIALFVLCIIGLVKIQTWPKNPWAIDLENLRPKL